MAISAQAICLSLASQKSDAFNGARDMPDAKTHRQDSIRYWHTPVAGGMDMLYADCVAHRFARHAHEEFVLAMYERGAEEFEATGKKLIAAEGSVLLIPPCIAHNGQAAISDGWSYRAFYPRLEFVREVSHAMFRNNVQPDAMAIRIFSDAPLFGQLANVHRFFLQNVSSLDREISLVNAIQAVLARVFPNAEARASGDENKAVAMAREFIHAHYSDPISGNEIAAAVGLSLPHLMRVFFKRLGVPINVYLISVRLGHARRLLRSGQRAAAVATEVGFADQSHLIRRFREAFGVTPGQYVHDSVHAY